MGFKRLNADDFVVSADAVQSTAWSTNAPTLTTFNTSSTQKGGSSGTYYLSVFQTASTVAGAAVQFDIAYGNVLGSGSTAFNSLYSDRSPSSTTYGQYRTMILEDENSSFTYGDGSNTFTPDDFYVLSIDRARYKESIYPGTFNISLSGSTGEINLTDNSNVTTVATFLGSSKVYQIISGSNGSPYDTTGYVAASGSYGLLFPELGTILLNPAAVEHSIGVFAQTGSSVTDGTNQEVLFDSLVLGKSFSLNSQETISSDYVFCRAGNSEFNYSTNPSFISGSTGALVYSQFINNPQTYMTTVGMYNDSNELIAVAKLSRPLVKDFTKESLVRVKLDF
mgnify:CR=1 FL=1|tara:strand:- start:1024 stop:2034 length:1011 start_codon:yes stop_codon:yes gene_type:complete